MSDELEPDSQQRSARLLLVALVSLGFVARLTLAFAMGDGHAARQPESAEYLAIARSVAEGDGFVLPAASTTGPADGGAGADAARHMPGYPLILAAAEAAFDAPDRAVLIFQSLCGGATLIVVIAMAARLAGLWAAVVAAAMLTFDPYQVYFSAQMVPVVPVGLALVAVTALTLKFLGGVSNGARRGWVWAALAGLALAAATYLEAWAAGFVLLAGLAALAAKQRKRLLTGWAVAVAALVVALAPWLIRNAVEVGAPVLTTDAGLRLYEGTIPTGDRPEVPAPPEGVDEVGRCVFYLRHAAGRIAEVPASWLGRAPHRVGRLWAPGSITGADGGPLHPAAGYTSLLPTAALALVGLAVFRRRRVTLWLLLAPVYVTLVHVVLPGPASDRLAVMPSLAVLGGVGVATLLGRGEQAIPDSGSGH